MATGSLVCGIIAIVISIGGGAISFGWIGCILGILAIIFGAIAKKQGPSGPATAGLVLGIIAVVYGGIATIACYTCLAAAGSALEGLGSIF